MFRKILIANRGEISLRVNRAAHELGIKTVAIFSEADRESLHTMLADEAFCVGPGPSARSYLNIPNIISAALISGAEAIHPGYGFLAENARFAEICAQHGLTFIGPSPSVIKSMGDKATAKRIAAEAAVATTPGTGVLESIEEAREAAARIGFPVLLKATAGGGGKGMREVRSDADLDNAYPTAQAEAEANFRDGRLYLEKLLEHPRHIEVQVLGDSFGNVIHLGERDCSIQKASHQKLIEESPAPNISAALRSRLHEMAIAAARAVNYTTAGTVEFLVAGDDVYFMEMNTRIQVEHCVTEMLYGVDLVAEQIRIASGEAMTLSQQRLHASGHALECRINAETAEHNFAPSAGKLESVVFPGGPGVRVDAYARSGFSVPPYYDSLLGKIIVHAATREDALDRMDAALADTRITGLNTTVDVCRRILADPGFRTGGVPVDYLPALMERAGFAGAR